MKTETSNTTETEALNKANVSGSCYRIVTDEYLGYEVQKKRRFLFFSWWEQLGHIYANSNTFKTIDEAKEWIKNGCKKKETEVNKVVWVSDNCR